MSPCSSFGSNVVGLHANCPQKNNRAKVICHQCATEISASLGSHNLYHSENKTNEVFFMLKIVRAQRADAAVRGVGTLMDKANSTDPAHSPDVHWIKISGSKKKQYQIAKHKFCSIDLPK